MFFAFCSHSSFADIKKLQPLHSCNGWSFFLKYMIEAVYFIIFTVLPSAVRTMLMPRCSFWSFIPEAL